MCSIYLLHPDWGRNLASSMVMHVLRAVLIVIVPLLHLSVISFGPVTPGPHIIEPACPLIMKKQRTIIAIVMIGNIHQSP